MKQEAPESSDAPLELLNAAESMHKGLRNVQLEQIHGAGGWVMVPGGRWAMENDAGDPPKHDERPNVSSREIATKVYEFARKARLLPGGGDARFRAMFFFVEDNGEVKSKAAKFEAHPMLARGPAGETVEQAQARTYIHTMDILLGHVQTLHSKVESLTTVVPDAIGTLIDKVLEMAVKVVAIRIEAGEEISAARAMRAGATSDTGKVFREAARELVGIANGPVGIAAAARLTGMSPEQLVELIGQKQPAAAESEADTELAKKIAALSASITMSQRMQLLDKLGASLGALKSAGEAKNDNARRAAITELLDGLRDEHWAALEKILTEAQGKLLGEIMELVQRVTH